MSALIIYDNNDNIIELRLLTNAVTEVIDGGATVSVTLKDASGVDVAGQTWPTNMPHVGDSNTPEGTYRATLDSTLVLSTKQRYKATVDAVGSGGEVGQWICSVSVVERC